MATNYENTMSACAFEVDSVVSEFVDDVSLRLEPVVDVSTKEKRLASNPFEVLKVARARPNPTPYTIPFPRDHHAEQAATKKMSSVKKFRATPGMWYFDRHGFLVMRREALECGSTEKRHLARFPWMWKMRYGLPVEHEDNVARVHAKWKHWCENEAWLEYYCRENRKLAKERGMKFWGRRYQKAFHGLVPVVRARPNERKRVRLAAHILRRLRILSGEAQSLFGVDLNVKLEGGTRHEVTTPLTDLLRSLRDADPTVNWLDVASEIGFFFTHLLTGGLTYSNFGVSFAHLLKNLPYKGLREKLSHFFNRNNAQSGPVEAMHIVGLAISGLVSVFSIWGFSKLPSDKDTDKFIQRFANLGRCISSMEKLSSVSDSLTAAVTGYVKKSFWGYDDSDEAAWADVTKFCDDVQEHMVTGWELWCRTEEGRQVVMTLLQRADNIMKTLDALRAPPSACTRFRNSVLLLHRMREQAADGAIGKLKSRVPPLLLHLYGGTGTGKSTVLDYLNMELLVALGSRDPDDLINKVYYRFPGNEFYDGFQQGTEIVVCDDFGSLRDTEMRPSGEGLETIRMTNGVPYRPPMAHLVDKASAVFEAKVVIWTSNQPNFRFPSMTNPEAVVNRVHLRFQQVPAMGYGKEKFLLGKKAVVLDSEKVAREALVDKTVYRRCLEFIQQDPSTDANMGAPMTFDQMATIVKEELKNRLERGGAVREDKKAYFKKLIGEAQLFQPKVIPETNRWRPREAPRGTRETRNVTPEEDCEPATVGYEYGHVLNQGGVLQGFLQRLFYGEKYCHINVLETCMGAIRGMTPAELQRIRHLAAADLPIPVPEEFEELIASDCIMVPASKVAEASRIIKEAVICWRLGEGVRYMGELAALGAQVCGRSEHFQGRAKWTLFDKLLNELLCGAVLVGVGPAIWWLTHLPTSFVGQFLYGIATYGVLKVALEFVLRPLFSKVWELCFGKKERGSEERYDEQPRVVRSTVESEPILKKKQVRFASPEVYPHDGLRVPTPARVEGEQESFSDQNGVEIRSKVYQNSYMISTSGQRNGTWRKLGTVTMVTGRVGMTNRHIVENFDSWLKIERVAGARVYVVATEACTVATFDRTDEKYGQRDVALVEFASCVPIHKSLKRFFMTAEDFSQHDSLDKVSLVGFSRIDGIDVLRVLETDKVKPDHESLFELTAGGIVTAKLRNFYLYGLETMPGDCGSLLVALDKRFPRKICGVHAAGVDLGIFTGVATAIHEGVLSALLVRLVDQGLKHSHSLTEGDFVVDKLPNVYVEGNILKAEEPLPGFTLSGEAHSRVHRAVQSSIRPSPVAKILGPVKKAPAKLTKFRKGDLLIDPMSLAMEKAATPSLHVNQRHLRTAGNAVEQLLIANALSSDAQVLSFAEGVMGRLGDERYPPINRSTSPGYGWSKVGKGKTRWLGSDDFVLDNPELKARYREAFARLENGQRVGAYWTDTLKDELRPIERVEAGKTRLFSAGEMVLTILLRQYFDGIAAHMARNAVDVESCVGVNVYELDWNRIAMKLKTRGPHVVAGDFSNYDGTLPAEVLWEVLRVINAYYTVVGGATAEQNRIRELLWVDIVNSIHVNGSYVYEWDHSQPSGCPFTSVLNSIVHSIIVRMCFLACAEKAGVSVTMDTFDEHVAHVNYGDDDVTNVSPVILDWFNQITMAEGYSTFGMTYTDETKSGELVRAKTLSEIQFLKRSFRWDETQQRYRAPLSLDTILEMACWNKTKSNDQWVLTSLVLKDAVAELGQHPRDVWDAHIGDFRAAAREIAPFVRVTLPLYDDLQLAEYYKIYGVAETMDFDGCERVKAGLQCRCTFCYICPKHGGCGTHCIECKGPTRFPTESMDLELIDCGCEAHKEWRDTMIGDSVESLKYESRLRCAWIDSACWVYEDPIVGVCQSGVGEVFTSSDECSPAIKPEMANRILIQRAAGDGLSLPPGEVTKLATTTIQIEPEGIDVCGNARVSDDGKSFTIEVLPNDPRLTLYPDDMPEEMKAWLMDPNPTLPPLAIREAVSDPDVDELSPEEKEKLPYELLHVDANPDWYELNAAFVDVFHAFNAVLEHRAAVPTWLPSGIQMGNTIRSVSRAANALVSLNISPGVIVEKLLTGPAQSGDDSSEPAPDFAGDAAIVHRQEVVEFHEDGEVHESERSIATTIPRELQTSGEDALRNDIIGFLQRPVLLQDELRWTVNHDVTHRLASFSFPRDWIKIPMIAEKLQGFRYLRCTFVIEIQLNSQPFNAGALMAYFVPLGQQLRYLSSNRSHWAGKMGFPHVIYRCGQATAVQLRVPFFSSISHYDLTEGYGSAGEVFLEVFSQLTGTSEVDGTVWAWAENVDISMPTGLPALIPTLTGEAQSGRAEARRPGTIETIAAQGAKVATALSSLPGLGAVANMGKTLFGTASSVASMFGWSKPNDPEFPTEVQPLVAKSMTNFNGDAKTRVLALDFKNSKNLPLDVFNSSEDEMAFKALVKKPVYLDRFTFNGDAQQTALLWSFPVDPVACKKKDAADTNSVARYETNLSFLTTCAKYWRGGLKYRFMAMKTPFHSGRVRVTFVPGADRTTDFIHGVDINKCYSQVYDLRESADIEFTIPYSYNQPWKPTEWVTGPPEYDRRLDDTYVSPMGFVYVTVVNALRNPAVASSTIEFVVLISGDDDFQLAYPGVNPHAHVLSRGSDVAPQTFSGPAQSAMYDSSTTTDPVNADTFGEAFTGFRQWLKRYHLVATQLGVGVTLRPFSFGMDIAPSLAKDLARPDTAFDKVSPLFRFQSGSMRVLFARRNNSFITERAENAVLVAPQEVESTASKGTAETSFAVGLEPIPEFTVPMYQPWVAILTRDGAPLDSLSTGVGVDGQYRFLPSNEGNGVALRNTVNGEVHDAYLAIGEDFSYGFLQGVPIQVYARQAAPPPPEA